MHKWFVYESFEGAAKAAAKFLFKEIGNCLSKKEVCHVILPGGNSPIPCLDYLSKENLPWDKIHWYLGDERCYPVGHDERNDLMLEKNLWSKIGDTNIYSIPAELGAEKAAEEYRKIISSVEYFDIAFLGVGEDGHTASLFPDNRALTDNRTVVPVYHSPKPPSDRVSLSIDTLKNARCRVVLTGVSAKKTAITRIKQGEPLPINCIGEINWFVDDAV